MARILVIEDDAAQVEILRRWLPDHELEISTTGIEAREQMSARRWDLIVSDVELPGLTGLELLERRGANASPTLIITSHADLSLARQAMKLGAGDLLPKPFGKADLRAACDRLLDLPRARSRRVLAIGAHPDDVEIGVGGTLAQHRANGDTVTILTLSQGAAGGETEQRVAEAKRAAEILGATLHLGDLPDRRIECGPETIGLIEQIIREFEPDVVYTHSQHDRHQDHRAVHEATRIAARNVANLYAYQAPSTTIDFRPARFVDIEDALPIKLDAIAAYASQSLRAYMAPERVRAEAIYWGRFARYAVVEPLEILRESRCP